MEGDASLYDDRCDAWALQVIAELPPNAALPPVAAGPRPDLGVQAPFAVLIRWQARDGQRHEANTVLDRLTPTEVELQLAHPLLAMRRPPLLIVRLALDDTGPALRLACLGTVQRIEPLPDGRWSHTITFARYRLLYATPAGPDPPTGS